jgi:diguanylate cyclase (GGDEF)-like protein/PAS domain S-box-containing protein
MPIDHTGNIPSAHAGLQDLSANGAVARPGLWRRLLARMQGDDASHRWVRVAMYAMLGMVAALALVQAWRSEQAEAVRRVDVEIIRVAAEQSALSQRMGTLAVMLAVPAFDREERHSALRDSIELAKAEARRLEALLTTQGALQSDSPASLVSALNVWQESRARFWSRAQDVLSQPDRADMTALTREIQALHNDLETILIAIDVLVLEVQSAAQERSATAARQIRVQVGVALLFLLLMALAVVEPTARAVRRQHLALSRQAVRLKRLALAAGRSSNAVVLADAERRVVWVNEAFTQMMGYPEEKALGQRFGDLLREGSADPATFEAFREAVQQGHGLKREIKISAAGGERRWALVDVQPIFSDAGALSGWVLVATDLTDLRAQQQVLERAVEGAGLGIWHWDIENGTIQCNSRMLEIMGYQSRELAMMAKDWNALIHPDDFSPWTAAVRAHLRDPASPLRMSVRLLHGSGRWVWMMLAGTAVDRSADGRALHMAGVAMDVQAQKVMEQQLRTAARTDGLTQLPNRTVVLDGINAALERGRVESGYNFAVLFMDFDRFKQVNDTLGHSVGDELLRQISQRLQDSLRPGDSFMRTSDFAHIAARIGGDEFVVLLDDIRGGLEAEMVAGRLLDVLAMPYTIGPHKVNSTVSIGIVTSDHAAEDADNVLRDADIAMYEAKRTGRARYALFDPAMRQQVHASVALENDLRQALDQHQIFVVYQPLIDLATGGLGGMEALMRWRHPQRGLVPPVEFIPVAENCGLIGALGQFVLQTACRAFASMQAVLGSAAPPSVAVNLSRAQLHLPGLVAEVQDVLRATGVSCGQLVLEVTESLAAQDERVINTLHELRALGVALSLDDFGTGYSSLSCLHELPVDFVKIDRSFVSLAQSSDYRRVLIEATIRMAQTLGLGTVAEGIETAEQAQLMATLGCDKGQGYLYSKPLEAEALVNWVQSTVFMP